MKTGRVVHLVPGSSDTKTDAQGQTNTLGSADVIETLTHARERQRPDPKEKQTITRGRGRGQTLRRNRRSREGEADARP